ncbi:unnamed protein product [Adineta steineri]|uniref:Cullin family profile domain-containing protein n=1 Tax=Adineta steineri TaxID=433720 RepID=A0A813QF06_9BILA|nr:unnamed protein product [Adineta steineri]CAF4039443.1 unnamed protein product [Adineta steineri]
MPFVPLLRAPLIVVVITIIMCIPNAATRHMNGAAIIGRCAHFSIQAGTAITFDGVKTNVACGSVGVAPGTSITGISVLGTNYTKEANTVFAINCAADELIAYGYLKGVTCNNILANSDLSGVTLFPGVYCTGSETIFFPTDILNIIVGKLIVFASDENNYQELTMLFELIHGSPEFKNEFLKLIETHVYQKAIESIGDDLINNPLSYIETIVNIHAKYLKLIEKIFVRDQSFDKGYAKFINQNPVSKRINIAMTLAEIIVRYCDTSLRKGSKAIKNDEWNEKLDNIIIIFSYLNDKDVFMKFYQKMLRKRLIDQLSVSESYEETLISEFKKKCGYEYTSKLEQMIKDIRLSDDLTKQYRTYEKNTHGNEINFFSVMVLSSRCWLFSQPSDIILPIEFKTIYDNFTTFYISKHTGRKLTLLHQYSKGELQINFTTKKHRVQVSTYQMMVLLLFNQELIWTFEQIQDKTQICSELLFEILSDLLKSKLLISDDPLTSNSRIKLAQNFVRPNEQKDESHLMKTTIDERQMIIQATLVRIMKKERTLKHSLLIQQVIQQLTSNFEPDISLIKKYIEILIEKEYFRRDSKDKDTLHYLA